MRTRWGGRVPLGSEGAASLLALLVGIAVLGVVAALVLPRLSGPAPRPGASQGAIIQSQLAASGNPLSAADLDPSTACMAEHETLTVAEEAYFAQTGAYGAEDALIKAGLLRPSVTASPGASPTLYWAVQSPPAGATAATYVLAKVNPRCPSL